MNWKFRLIAFAKKHLSDIDASFPPKALEGGNLNFVWRIQRAAGNARSLNTLRPILPRNRILFLMKAGLSLKAAFWKHFNPAAN
jgi:hypothetical protein